MPEDPLPPAGANALGPPLVQNMISENTIQVGPKGLGGTPFMAVAPKADECFLSRVLGGILAAEQRSTVANEGLPKLLQCIVQRTVVASLDPAHENRVGGRCN